MEQANGNLLQISVLEERAKAWMPLRRNCKPAPFGIDQLRRVISWEKDALRECRENAQMLEKSIAERERQLEEMLIQQKVTMGQVEVVGKKTKAPKLNKDAIDFFESLSDDELKLIKDMLQKGE